MPVNYSRQDVAVDYASGRDLGDEILARWKLAVVPFVPVRPILRILDVGAGTGIFARAWTRWCRCQVIGLEPSAAMRAEMARSCTPSEVAQIGGRAQETRWKIHPLTWCGCPPWSITSRGSTSA
ncbi:MAG: class I SAM-dependent methyltransferase [Acidimicrobiales bacterium]